MDIDNTAICEDNIAVTACYSEFALGSRPPNIGEALRPRAFFA